MKKSKIVKLSLNKKMVSALDENLVKGGMHGGGGGGRHTCPNVSCSTCTTALFTACENKQCF